MSSPKKELIILAREAREYTQEMLSTAIGVAQGTLSRIENGQLQANEEIIGKIATALDFPVEFFSQEMRVQELPPSFFRRRLTGVPQKTVKAIRAHWAMMIRSLPVLLSPVEFPEPNVPSFDLHAASMRPTDAAREVRVRWHVPMGPVANVTVLLEQMGVLIVAFDFGTDRIDGMSVYDRSLDLPPVIFVNKNIPGERQRFTLGHELAHLVIHSHLPPSLEDSDVEHEADAFASEFLIPSEEVRGHLVAPTLSRLLGLKLYWKVSAQALLMKADDLGLLSDQQREHMWRQLSRQGWRTREPNPLPREEPSLLRQLIQLHEDKLQYSEEDLCKILCVNRNDLRSRYPVTKARVLRLVP